MNIIKEVNKLKLPLGEYVVVGSGPIAARGLRPAHDIDLLVTQDLYDQLKAKGWREENFPETERPWALFHGSFDASTSWDVKSYRPDSAKLIKEAETIKGVPFVRLEEVLQWKKACGRDKDLKDIALIEDHLKSHHS